MRMALRFRAAFHAVDTARQGSCRSGLSGRSEYDDLHLLLGTFRSRVARDALAPSMTPAFVVSAPRSTGLPA